MLGVLWARCDWGAVSGEGEWRVTSWRQLAHFARVSRALVRRALGRWCAGGLVGRQAGWDAATGGRLGNG